MKPSASEVRTCRWECRRRRPWRPAGCLDTGRPSRPCSRIARSLAAARPETVPEYVAWIWPVTRPSRSVLVIETGPTIVKSSRFPGTSPRRSPGPCGSRERRPCRPSRLAVRTLVGVPSRSAVCAGPSTLGHPAEGVVLVIGRQVRTARGGQGPARGNRQLTGRRPWRRRCPRWSGRGGR